MPLSTIIRLIEAHRNKVRSLAGSTGKHTFTPRFRALRENERLIWRRFGDVSRPPVVDGALVPQQERSK
jgi:hypothetical protein